MAGDLRLRQICLAATGLEPAAGDLAAILRTPVCRRDPGVGAYGLENVLFAIGPRFLELVAPIREGTAAERFLHRSGGKGGYMAIFECADPAARRAHAEAIGIKLAHESRHDGYHGVQLHPRDCRAAMIEFNHTEGGGEPFGPYWPAGPEWQTFLRPEATRALVQVEIESPVSPDLALHWSRVLQAPVTGPRHGARIEIEDCALVFRSAPPGTREVLSALTLAVADVEASLAAASARGYAVTGNAFFAAGVVFRLRE